MLVGGLSIIVNFVIGTLKILACLMLVVSVVGVLGLVLNEITGVPAPLASLSLVTNFGLIVSGLTLWAVLMAQAYIVEFLRDIRNKP